MVKELDFPNAIGGHIPESIYGELYKDIQDQRRKHGSCHIVVWQDEKGEFRLDVLGQKPKKYLYSEVIKKGDSTSVINDIISRTFIQMAIISLNSKGFGVKGAKNYPQV